MVGGDPKLNKLHTWEISLEEEGHWFWFGHANSMTDVWLSINPLINHFLCTCWSTTVGVLVETFKPTTINELNID